MRRFYTCPPCLAKIAGTSFCFGVGCLFAFGPTLLIRLTDHRFTAFSVYSVGFLASFFGWIFTRQHVRRLLARAAASGNHLCVYCTFKLSVHSHLGLCPECGKRYDKLHVAADWAEGQRRFDRLPISWLARKLRIAKPVSLAKTESVSGPVTVLAADGETTKVAKSDD